MLCGNPDNRDCLTCLLLLYRHRAIYSYTHTNDDEVDLKVGDIVYVLEKCDDGWYVGTCERTGSFGTFPGNYVVTIS